MATIIIDPFDERQIEQRRSAPPISSLNGKTIGLLDISKPGGKSFLDRVAELLKARYESLSILRFSKPTYTKPAPDTLLLDIAYSGCHGVIEALAD